MCCLSLFVIVVAIIEIFKKFKLQRIANKRTLVYSSGMKPNAINSYFFKHPWIALALLLFIILSSSYRFFINLEYLLKVMNQA